MDHKTISPKNPASVSPDNDGEVFIGKSKHKWAFGSTQNVVFKSYCKIWIFTD